MNFPLSLSDISLWLAVTAIIVLATSEVLFSTKYSKKIVLDKQRLRLIALILGASFMATVILRIFRIF